MRCRQDSLEFSGWINKQDSIRMINGVILSFVRMGFKSNGQLTRKIVEVYAVSRHANQIRQKKFDIGSKLIRCIAIRID